MNKSTQIKSVKVSQFQLVFIVVLFLSGFQMVGQTTTEVNNEVTVATTVKMDLNNHSNTTANLNDDQNANMNFFSWFMGGKQNPSSNISKDSSTNLKKQMINNGVEPNRILIKTFLKKASTYSEVLA